ncbi:hypothetical protein LAZ67_23000433 [Cordylochernes scorpioides]|uniref:Uncharacterized protein n=1 Tax=Cordylochernes scorpioides TaxID=51811 RepID=A0ABY6LUS4_9ARAC|nr:hypothetical protein LAZ67_23000433 [Cordylochernes scorpioides]
MDLSQIPAIRRILLVNGRCHSRSGKILWHRLVGSSTRLEVTLAASSTDRRYDQTPLVPQTSDEEVIDAVTSFFESLETSFFLEGIKALEHRLKKCINLKRDYVEK